MASLIAKMKHQGGPIVMSTKRSIPTKDEIDAILIAAGIIKRPAKSTRKA